MLIACEGIDGSGKSTLVQDLGDYFTAQGRTAILTKEPGGTPFGKQLRAMLQQPTAQRCAQAEFLLFAADRAQHYHEVIAPALQKGTIIISDRLADSSLVYQGYGRGLSRKMINTINAWALQNTKPELTIYLRITLETSRKRIEQRNLQKTTFEQEHYTFFQRLIDGFDTLYKNRTDVIIVDGSQSSKAVSEEVIQKITPFMHNRSAQEFSHERH